MDLVHDIIAEEEEDRISNLPDDIIHCILSYLDMKYVIQTSTLSKKWKHIWTSLPYLNFNSKTFLTLPRFENFVKHALYNRNQCTEVSTVELEFTGAANQSVVKNIVKYAYSHNVRQLSIIWWSKFSREFHEFPQDFFSSHTLKHLTLEIREEYYYAQRVPISAWDLPALETLYLSNAIFSDSEYKNADPFSKCVNLKDLTLHHGAIFGFDIFHVCAPQLSNLTITDLESFPRVLNVVAPQLQNLTASVNTGMSHVNGSSFLQLSTEGLDSLEKVNLSLSIFNYKKERDVPQLLDLFRKLHNAKFLILNYGVIEALSSCPDLLVREPCPFSNLKCLKIDNQKNRTATVMPDQLRSYLLESSPSATFIMDLPQVEMEVREQLLKAKLAARQQAMQAQMAARQQAMQAQMAARQQAMQAQMAARQQAMQAQMAARQQAMQAQMAARQHAMQAQMVVRQHAMQAQMATRQQAMQAQMASRQQARQAQMAARQQARQANMAARQHAMQAKMASRQAQMAIRQQAMQAQIATRQAQMEARQAQMEARQQAMQAQMTARQHAMQAQMVVRQQAMQAQMAARQQAMQVQMASRQQARQAQMAARQQARQANMVARQHAMQAKMAARQAQMAIRQQAMRAQMATRQ